MDTRKRKRILKPLNSFAYHNLSLLSLALCFLFGMFVLFISHEFRVGSCGFRPTRIIPSLSSFSSKISNSIHESLSSRTSNGSGLDLDLDLKIENRVLFTDRVLVVLSTNGEDSSILLGEMIECVYSKSSGKKKVTVAYPMLAVEEYHNGRLAVGCPLPPANYSAVVALKGHMAGFDWTVGTEKNETVKSWDMLAYESVFDGEETVAVFVKGLNLRSDRKSDPSQFNCHFSIGSFELTTKAITAAQEVIRCPLPRDLKNSLKEDDGIQVTVEVTSPLQRRSTRVPSIAKLYKANHKGKYKHELCACTMVWNQASFVREWITYHAWLGIQRWFIYDNNSDDGLKEIINELDSENYNVTRHVWPWVKSQEAGFAHCMITAREQCKWVAFFDVDEFYYFPRRKNRPLQRNLDYPGPNSLRAIVENVSVSSPSVAQIKTDCLNFGPSGLKTSPARGVTLGYTCRLQTPERHKSIVRPDGVDDTLLNQVHHFRLKKEFIGKTFSPSTLVINHYKYQVWDVFKSKFRRRVSTYVVDWQENQKENSRDRAPGLGTKAIEPPNWHLRFCEVWDTRLRDFVLANLADSTTGSLPWESSGR